MRWVIPVLCALQCVHALWPAPAKYVEGDKLVKLDKSFKIEVKDLPGSIPGDLKEAIEDAEKQIKRDNMRALVVDLAALEKSAKECSNTLKRLTLTLGQSGGGHKRRATHADIRRSFQKRGQEVSSITNEINKPHEERDESYQLEIKASSEDVTLTAPTTLGLLRGLQTFTQLVYTTNPDDQKAKPTRYIMKAPISIEDKPAYYIRGLLLDTARNYYRLRDIKRTLNAMSYSKMNYFHWHITDSQSWPLLIPSHPELSGEGAYSQEKVYTLKQVKDVFEHANRIGIEVMLEIDVPGHTGSIALSHSDLLSCTDLHWNKNGVAAEPNPGQLKPTSEDALKLVKEIFRDIAKVIPGRLLGTGGDEVNKKCFENDTSVQSVLTANGQTIDQAIAHFVTEAHKTVIESAKVPVVWEESVIGETAAQLDPSTIVTSWKSNTSIVNVTQAGYRSIQAWYEHGYLDCGMGAWVGAGDHWCKFVSWWTMYDSLKSLESLSAEQKKLVMGGQASLWSEQAGPEVVDALIWPRAAAVGEVWWLGEQGVNGQGLNATGALGRLHDFRYRLVQRNIAARPLQPHWCALRPEQCLF
ncbi:glycoside hydrolase family 20 protein [Cystobasidium minutum MCA 4210]|uniref:glycoside hydrolase family 20 protein n=1 Tax=Cystobasidium minutum MCA 4210 TaxID=1397322 RepID=UPI0034D009C7|eukprot:jgi/Rhomi1/209259/estExt_Genemark1.C_2_t30092